MRGGDGAGTRAPRVVIVGAGFSGIAAAVELRRRGIRSVTILEQGDRVGGVWRDNTYPGAACDVPSHLYSFSWARNPDWSLRYATRDEIQGYLEQVARDHDVLPHCRFGAEVARARWDDDAATWTVELTDGQRLDAEVLITGTGQLNRPTIPDVPGRDTFAGTAFHSARWDHDADLSGRDVVVVGTGASAIQFVPPVAEVARSVTVLQRSAPWVVRKPDRTYGPFERRAFASVPGWARAYRAHLYWRSEGRWPAFRGDPLAGRLATGLALRHLRRSVPDEVLRRRLTPDHTIGCKRILQSNDWYPALQRPDVTVIDGGLARIEPDAVVTDTGDRVPCDTIVWGTGFHTTDLLAPMAIHGRAGRALDDAWHEGAEAHLGITVPGFPNLFLLYGPNTNLGHNSIIFMLEAQARYTAAAVATLRSNDLASIEVRGDVHRRFNDRLQERLRQSVWADGCGSWYVDEHGRIVNNWVGSTVEYHWRARRFRPRDHHLVPRAALPTRTDLDESVTVG